jgi:serine/threonine-protein kinase
MRNGLPEEGDVIADKYTVESELGRGGMGHVYRVVHRLTDKRLALKCLLPKYADNPTLVERFLREARTAGRIQHRHVIDVFDVGRQGDLLYLVMPLLEGKPLSELLEDETLSLHDALVVLLRAMEGVAAAHELGIVHRDLKPQNIFVCVGVSGRLDDPRVLDFGISKLDDELGPPLTHSGVAVGTPHYMALEQLTGQRDLDQRVDVYAMGVILYEAITGRPPHTADNIAGLAIRLMHAPPLHLLSVRPDIPSGLADAVMRALERERELRFPSMRAMIEAISRFVPSGELLIRESHGPRLRTPRDSNRVDSAIAQASATTVNAQERPQQAIPSGIPRAHRAGFKRRYLALALALVAIPIVAIALRPHAQSNATKPPATQPAAPPPTPISAPTVVIAEPPAQDAGLPPLIPKRPPKKRAVTPSPVVEPAPPAKVEQQPRGDLLSPEEF